MDGNQKIKRVGTLDVLLLVSRALGGFFVEKTTGMACTYVGRNIEEI